MTVNLTIPLAPNTIAYRHVYLDNSWYPPLPEPITKEKTVPNIALLNTVMDHIEAHPEVHDQALWINTEHECGTAACFAGWTVLINGNAVIDPETRDFELSWTLQDIDADFLLTPGLPEIAMRVLGLTFEDARYMFNENRTREELRARVDELSADLDAELVSLVDEIMVPA